MEPADGMRAVTLDPRDAEAVTALHRACEAHDGVGMHPRAISPYLERALA